MFRSSLVLMACGAAAALAGACAGAPGDNDLPQFVERAGSELLVQNSPFKVAGSNNYYLIYKSQAMVDDVLAAASAAGFNTLRTWGSLDIGNQDDTGSIRGKADGVYFQYWNGTAPAQNDGPDGLVHLDYVIAKARQLHIRLIIPFVNNWNDFGGMDQYVRWRGGQTHDDFYTDPVIRGWYQAWISHLLNRVNTITGIAYKNDPTILAWELANEPRCVGGGVYPRSDSCSTQTLIAWADDVSRFVKKIDRRHLVSAGDEGFFCTPGATDGLESCGDGVDTVALARLPAIDLMSYHLYPDYWGKDAAWATDYIKRHIQAARGIRKPALLGEFGLLDKSKRNPVYKEWTDTVLLNGGGGAMYWMLAGKQDNGSLYPDYDGFTVYCPSPVCATISNFARLLLRPEPACFPPVADNDSAVVPFDTPVTLHATANDVTYGNVALLPDALDLDPATAGQQTTLATAAGTFALQPGGDVLFTPTPGFSGDAVASYVVLDARRRASNVAGLTVTVKPDPNAALKLFSFEDGPQGWAPASWANAADSVAQSSAFATDGSHGLEVNAAGDDWFGLTFSPPASFTPKTHLKWDLMTTGSGTSQNLALQLGDGWIWCQGANWAWTNPGTTAQMDVDLTQLSCSDGSAPDVSKVQGLYVFFNAGGTYYIDNVRAE